MLDVFLEWCNQESPQSESENMVIRYGAELLIDNCLKIIFLLILGGMFGKGLESVVFLFVFCSLRFKAGGFHAKTGWGCALCMSLVWAIGILAAEQIRMSLNRSFFIGCFPDANFIWKSSENNE